MISFGDLKNHISQLKKYLNKMGLFKAEEHNITPKDLQEDCLRKRHNQIFLPLINYILLQFSRPISIKIIEAEPTIRIMKDKQFVQAAFRCCRNLFAMDIQLTTKNFLSQKYFQKKVQLLSTMAKKAFEWEQLNNKVKSKYQKQYQTPQLQQEEEEEVRIINVQPVAVVPPKKKIQQPKPQNNKLMEYLEDDQLVEERPQKLKKTQPKGRWNQWQDEEQDQRQIKKQNTNIQPKFTSKSYVDDYEKYQVKDKSPIPKYKAEPVQEYVTKQQFQQIIGLVKTLTQSVNYTSEMFQNFQTKIQSQYGKMNARLTLMEATVKMLKDNL